MLDSTAAGQDRHDLWDSRRLWSLWDMFELKGSAFYEATIRLAALSTWVTAAGNDETDAFHRAQKLTDEDRSFVIPRLNGLVGHLEVLGAQITLMAVSDAKEALDRQGATWGLARERIDEISRTL